MSDASNYARFLDWWLGRVWPDLLIAGGVVGTHFLAHHLDWISHVPEDISPDRRGLIYVALSTVTALAAGTNNTAVGSYVSSSGDIVDSIRKTHGAAIRLSLRNVGGWLWFVAVSSLGLLALDPLNQNKPHAANGAGWIAEGLIVLAMVKFTRLTFIQDLLLAANDKSRQSEVRPRRTLKRATKPSTST